MDTKIKILSIDDDDINLMLLRTLLKTYKLKNTILEAKNGLEAMEILDKNQNINLIFLDLKMPIMDGFDFLANINEKSPNKIPVVVVTTDESQKAQALQKGAYEFLTKPIRKNKLFEKLDMLLDQSSYM